MNLLRRVTLLSLAIVGAASFAAAQSSTGSIKGVLTDDSGASIPAAFLTITNPAGQKQAQSQADGSYTFTGLQPGDYTLGVTYPGFGPFSKVVTVSVGGTVTLPIQLAVVAEKQEITVKGEPGPSVSVEPDNNVGALVIKGDDLMALPDDPDDLSDALQALAGPGAGPNGGAIYIDGFSGGQLPPKESIREIRINQNPFSAEFDRLGFGRIEILTKPGTDQLSRDGYFNDTRFRLGFAQSVRQQQAALFQPQFRRQWRRTDQSPDVVQLRHPAARHPEQRHYQRFLCGPDQLSVDHLTTSLVTPTYNLTITPRIDYAISDKQHSDGAL